MKRIIRWVLLLFIIPSVVYSKPVVVTSTFLLSSIVRSVTGDRVSVFYIIPPSAMPHVFSPTPQELKVLVKARLFVGIGYGFEFWLRSISDMLVGKKVLLLSSLYRDPINPVSAGGITRANPHIWLDMVFMEKKGIPAITRALCGIDSGNCRFFELRERKMLVKLRKVIVSYRRFFSRLRNECFVEVDPAFSYYLRSFGVKPCGSLLEKGGGEPTLRAVVRLERNCGCKSGVVLYAFHRGVAKTVGSMLHYAVVFLNPLGDPDTPGLDSYIGLLEYDLEKLEKAIHDKP